MSRVDVRFPSGPGWCAAWWYEPDGVDAPGPVVIMAHGLGGVKEMRLDAYAERFVAEGYRVLVFDYRHFGASDGEPRELLDIQRQLDDWAAAMHHVRSVPQVDRGRIVLWGTSFGGGHVIEAASRDGGVAAIISQCPFTDGFASSRTVGLRSLLKLTVLGVRDALRGLRGKPPVRVAVAGRRGEAALMTAPDVVPGYLALSPPGPPPPDRVAARVALRIPLYYPGRAAASLECPALFCVAMKDSVAPSRSTIWHVRKARHGRIKRYRTGHFDLYVEPWFDEVVTDQIEFLRETVPV
ncbi:alpha/beta hydrolase [Aeromicrobium ginsengisoli]|uniref:Alpha/beta hydrolase n=1 Tax=Aeromicrobium ginsengisoli TaxID=363867 RepID=A0A5M4FBP4_9ACTN|nr:alpha/beta fold hydrolase [Aeromicrobium ginsengisoli]KAA1395804.1 alpha/beta hydrolase [Aeromicrobium ginsengisoli]